MLWVALGFGIGSIFGNLAFSSAWNGLGAFKTGVNFHLCVTLQSGGTALLGGVLLFAWLLEYRFKIRWLALFVAALGFALGVLFQDLLALNLPESTGVRWWGFLPYVLWGAALVLLDKDWKKCLLYGSLVVLAVLAGRYLWLSIQGTLAEWSNISILFTAVGFMLGLFLSLGQRWQPALLLMVTVILAQFLQGAIPYPQEENIWLYLVDMLHFALVGAVIFMVMDLLGMLRSKRDIPVS